MYFFLSYGHGDHEAFISRFINDLESLPITDRLWVDHQLRLGDEYTDEINEAIDSCDAFIFVNSPHAARPGGYCSGEIQRAVDRGKKIITISVDDTPVTAIIAGRQRYFMDSALTTSGEINEEEYAKLFEKFAKELNSISPNSNANSYNATKVSDFQFIDFTELEVELLNRGSSPEPVLSKIDDWMYDNNPFLCVMGNAGSGKSTLSAEIHRRYKDRSIAHYCKHDDIHSVKLKNIVLQISYSLMDLNRAYADYVKNNIDFERLSIANTPLSQLFNILIVDPLTAIDENVDGTLLFIIDAFDEISNKKDREALEGLLLSSNIPLVRNGKLKVFVTSRNDRALRNNIIAIHGKMINEYEVENLESVRDIVNEFVSGLDYKLDDSLVDEVMKQSKGDIVYVKFILDEIAYKKPESLSDLQFPLGMKGVCTKHFDRVFEGDQAYFSSVAAPALEILVSAKTPISFNELQKICDITAPDLEGLLSRLSMFVESRQGVILFIHKSLRDWLVSMEPGEKYFVNREAGLNSLCMYCSKELSGEAPSEYAREFGLTHLAENKCFAEISNLMKEASSAFNDVFMRFVEETVSQGEQKNLVTIFKDYSSYDAESLFLVSETIKMLISRSQDLVAKKILRLYKNHSDSEMLNQFAEFYTKKRENASLRELQPIAETLIEMIDDDQISAEVMFALADIYREQGKYADAKDLYVEARDSALLEDLEGIAFDCSFALIDLEYVRGDYQKSHDELEKIKEDNPAWFETPTTNAYKYYRSLGHLYQIVESDELATKAYLNSYNIANDLNFLMKRMESANSIAEAQTGHEDGLAYLNEVRDLYHTHNLNSLEYGKSFYIESDLHYQDENYALAEEAASEAIRILTEVGYAGGVAHSRVSRGKARFRQGKHQEAFQDFQEAARHYDETEMRPRYRFEAYYHMLKIADILGTENVELADQTASFFDVEEHPFLADEYGEFERLAGV